MHLHPAEARPGAARERRPVRAEGTEGTLSPEAPPLEDVLARDRAGIPLGPGVDRSEAGDPKGIGGSLSGGETGDCIPGKSLMRGFLLARGTTIACAARAT
ncbi:hypothetical protein JHW43_009036 [Diplocarpon mali]|nr:hypothetical protein JHW43_009036 [Diplocarpon mali]